MFRRVATALGMPHLVTDPDYADDKQRLKNRDKLNAVIEEITKTRSSAEWIETLNRAGVPSGPIYRMNEVFADPQVEHLGIAQAVQHSKLGRMELVGQAVTLSRTPSKLETASPERGEHTDAVLRGLGYDADAIARLRAKGVV
jgi:formyl-CoA transferase